LRFFQHGFSSRISSRSFQFSFWDSLPIHINKIQKRRRCFQFSFWDSKRFSHLCSVRFCFITFNSLFEILPETVSPIINILRFQFSFWDSQHQAEQNYPSYRGSFQFSFWDSHSCAINSLIIDYFQFSFWDSN